MGQIRFRALQPSDAGDVARLVVDVFERDVAALYKPAGVEEFRRYATTEKIAGRMGEEHTGLVAEDEYQNLVGVVELREFRHISMLFVSGAMQRHGVGRALVTRALEMCREKNPLGATITVNATPNSVSAYERIGFRSSGPEQERNGIRFVPMALTVDEGS